MAQGGYPTHRGWRQRAEGTTSQRPVAGAAGRQVEEPIESRGVEESKGQGHSQGAISEAPEPSSGEWGSGIPQTSQDQV